MAMDNSYVNPGIGYLRNDLNVKLCEFSQSHPRVGRFCVIPASMVDSVLLALIAVLNVVEALAKAIIHLVGALFNQPGYTLEKSQENIKLFPVTCAIALMLFAAIPGIFVKQVILTIKDPAYFPLAQENEALAIRAALDKIKGKDILMDNDIINDDSSEA